MAVGAYEAVWLFVGFDLPTLTQKQRRFAGKFRTDLLKLGFTMFQLSFYKYYLTSKDKADTIVAGVEKCIPPEGKVSIFYLTDKQFSMIKTFYGGEEIDNEVPEQAILFE